jgi:protein-S-isoprenylcysteine O-methyltransferase Ste14
VDAGPYRLVRHPIYTGFIVMDVGLALLCGSALAFAGVAMMTVGLWIKARIEEQFLSEQLGAAAYSGYKARTPMLVPRLTWRPEAESPPRQVV